MLSFPSLLSPPSGRTSPVGEGAGTERLLLRLAGEALLFSQDRTDDGALLFSIGTLLPSDAVRENAEPAGKPVEILKSGSFQFSLFESQHGYFFRCLYSSWCF